MDIDPPRRRATDQAVPLLRPERALAGDAPWCASADLAGFQVEAADGRVGEVRDLVVEEETWAVTDLLVDIGGLPLTVPLGAVARVDWNQRRMYIRLTQEEILRAVQPKL